MLQNVKELNKGPLDFIIRANKITSKEMIANRQCYENELNKTQKITPLKVKSPVRTLLKRLFLVVNAGVTRCMRRAVQSFWLGFDSRTCVYIVAEFGFNCHPYSGGSPEVILVFLL